MLRSGQPTPKQLAEYCGGHPAEYEVHPGHLEELFARRGRGRATTVNSRTYAADTEENRAALNQFLLSGDWLGFNQHWVVLKGSSTRVPAQFHVTDHGASVSVSYDDFVVYTATT